MQAAALLRLRRLDAGISRREMARRAGTSSATLLKYERGDVSPGTDTFERLMAAALPRNRRWTSLGLLAGALEAEFERGHPEQAWRWALEVIDDEAGAGAEETRLFVSRRPDLTGRDQTDALVAAVAEHICVLRGIPTPRWLHEPRICRPFWFVSGLPSFQALAIRESPPSFASRGIFVTRAALMRA